MSAKVMVVDDESAIRSLLGTVLVREGYEVVEAGDAATLRDLFSGPQPDLILLDLKLPDGEGMELLPEVKQVWPGTEVIILTGHATLDAAVSATKAGAYDFQKKPFDHKSLLLAVAHAIEHKQLTEQASSLRNALSLKPASRSSASPMCPAAITAFVSELLLPSSATLAPMPLTMPYIATPTRPWIDW